MQNIKKKALLWLRNDLRIDDHFAFSHAAQNCDQLVAYYTFDPDHYKKNRWGFIKTGSFRTQFLVETMELSPRPNPHPPARECLFSNI